MWFFLNEYFFPSCPIFFLFSMMCLVLLILSKVLCIRDLTHCPFLHLNHHLILLCVQPTSLLGFLGPWIGMVFLFLLFRLLLIILLYPSLIIKLLLKSVGIKLYKINFTLFKTIIFGASSLVLLELSLLGVNGYRPLSYVLMALLNNINLI
jgi:hypothetical protein